MILNFKSDNLINCSVYLINFRKTVLCMIYKNDTKIKKS